jgi:hypothetical protein
MKFKVCRVGCSQSECSILAAKSVDQFSQSVSVAVESFSVQITTLTGTVLVVLFEGLCMGHFVLLLHQTSTGVCLIQLEDSIVPEARES